MITHEMNAGLTKWSQERWLEGIRRIRMIVLDKDPDEVERAFISYWKAHPMTFEDAIDAFIASRRA
jgi:hypothetical protein